MNKKSKSSENFWLALLSTGIILLLLLLISNVIAIVLAINANKHICGQSAQAAAAVCAGGGNQRDIAAAVVRVINDSPVRSFFISPPELDELRFYMKNDKGTKQQMLLVKTITEVRVPAPFLLFVTPTQQNGALRFSSSYIIKLKSAPLSHTLTFPIKNLLLPNL